LQEGVGGARGQGHPFQNGGVLRAIGKEVQVLRPGAVGVVGQDRRRIIGQGLAGEGAELLVGAAGKGEEDGEHLVLGERQESLGGQEHHLARHGPLPDVVEEGLGLALFAHGVSPFPAAMLSSTGWPSSPSLG